MTEPINEHFKWFNANCKKFFFLIYKICESMGRKIIYEKLNCLFQKKFEWNLCGGLLIITKNIYNNNVVFFASPILACGVFSSCTWHCVYNMQCVYKPIPHESFNWTSYLLITLQEKIFYKNIHKTYHYTIHSNIGKYIQMHFEKIKQNICPTFSKVTASKKSFKQFPHKASSLEKHKMCLLPANEL
jgi:hypothetical protein